MSGGLTFNAANNRITTVGYAYDAVGNLTSDNSHAYTFDAENKISKVDAVTAYTYDGEGQRVRKLVNENLRFIYDMGGKVIAEFNGTTGTLTKEYIYGASGLVATIEPTAINSNGTRYTTSDHLGSPRVVTNSAAVVISRHDYKPFGEEIGLVGGRTTGMGYSVADGVRQKFTSKERDTETGLDYFLARYYSSTQGRFTSPDEFKGGTDELYVLGTGDEEKQALPYAEITNPQSINKYTYTYNNPLRYVDPDGHDIEYENDRLRQQFENIAKESKTFAGELVALNDDHKITVSVVERGLKTNDEKSSGDATITFKSDGTTRVVIAVDSYGRTTDRVKEHEIGHGKDARTNRNQLRTDALKTQKNKGGPGEMPHDERPEEKRANAFRDQVERERKQYRKDQEAERKRQKQEQKRKKQEQE